MSLEELVPKKEIETKYTRTDIIEGKSTKAIKTKIQNIMRTSMETHKNTYNDNLRLIYKPIMSTKSSQGFTRNSSV